MMIRSQAFTVVRAAARFQVLAAKRRAEQEAEDQEQDSEALLAPSQQYGDGAGGGAGGGGSGGGGYGSPHALGSPDDQRSMQRSRTLSTAPGRVAWWRSDLMALKEMILGNWINLLLLAVPAGIAAGALEWNSTYVFTLNFLALIPLALVLGDVTEDLALRYGSIVGGLINATFGNIVEIILSIAALLNGLNDVVAASLLGSILSNLLLVTGCSFFFGGLFNKTQKFNAAGNQTSGSLLFLAALGFLIPTGAGLLFGSDDKSRSGATGFRGAWGLDAGDGDSENKAHDEMVLMISRGTAVILLLCYACYLGFQLYTHTDLFEEDANDEGAQEPMLSLATSVGMLTIITVTVAAASEYLSKSIETFSESSGLSKPFLGTIVLPIAGNACEHMTAVVVATKNKMDLSMGVAIGSSIQVALFAVPLVVVVGWVTGHAFSLSFDSFSALALMLSVAQVNFVTAGATSHWLLGVQLIALFVLLSLAYFFK